MYVRVYWFIHNDMCILYIHLKIISREKAIMETEQYFHSCPQNPLLNWRSLLDFCSLQRTSKLNDRPQTCVFQEVTPAKALNNNLKRLICKVRSSSTGQLHCCYVCSTRTWWRAFRRLECSSEVSSAIRMFIQFLVGHCQVYTIS